ncbi:hypothetical protein YQE_07444, partial [Dendroctonus ponderosae]
MKLSTSTSSICFAAYVAFEPFGQFPYVEIYSFNQRFYGYYSMHPVVSGYYCHPTGLVPNSTVEYDSNLEVVKLNLICEEDPPAYSEIHKTTPSSD